MPTLVASFADFEESPLTIDRQRKNAGAQNLSSHRDPYRTLLDQVEIHQGRRRNRL